METLKRIERLERRLTAVTAAFLAVTAALVLGAWKAQTASPEALRVRQITIVDESGTQTVVWEREGTNAPLTGAWRSASVNLDAWAGETIRLRFEALDGGPDSTVEAGIDDVSVTRPD